MPRRNPPCGFERQRHRDERMEEGMTMYNPPHPGESIRDLCLDPVGMSISAAARHLGVGRQSLSAVINGRAPISADLAIRLSLAFGGSPETWLRMQAAYDLWQARHSGPIDVKPVPHAA